MATQQVVLSEPLSADRAAVMGLDSRDYMVGEQITIAAVDASRLTRAGYVAVGVVTPNVVYGGGTVTIFDANNAAQPQRTRLRFAGSGVSIADDAANQWTNITITGGTGGTGGTGVTTVNGKGPGAVSLAASDVGAVSSVNGKGPGAVTLVAADLGALTLAAADNRYDPLGGLASTPAVVVASGAAYATRNTVTTNPTKTVIWVGASAPPIGGGFAVSGVDLWIAPDSSGGGGAAPLTSIDGGAPSSTY